MQVRAGVVIHSVEEKVRCFLGGGVSVHANQGHQVELKADPGFLEPLVVAAAHIDIALRVGEERVQSFHADLVERIFEGHGRAEIGRFDEQHVASFGSGNGLMSPDRQKFPFLEAVVKQRVDHVLRRQVEPDGHLALMFGGIGSPEFLEAGLQGSRLVGDVFHDVRGQPDFPDPDLVVIIQYLEGAFHRADPVVHPWQDMAVPVGGSLQEAAVQDRIVFGEGPHTQFVFEPAKLALIHRSPNRALAKKCVSLSG